MRSWLSKLIQKPEMVFLILATVFGSFSALVVPQLSVPDENMHFLRAYSIASGQITGTSDNKCSFPTEVYNRSESIYKGDYSSHYAQRVNLDSTTQEWCGTAAGYSPLAHIPQAIGVFIAQLLWPSTGVMILFGRLVSLAFFIGATYYIIKKVKIGKWAFVVIALFPTAIQQVASLSADSFTFVATFAAIAFLLNCAVQKSVMTRRQFVILLLLSAALILSKIPNVVLILFILFLPGRLFMYEFKRKSILLRPQAIKVYVFLAAGVFAALCAFIWLKIYNQSLIGPTPVNPIPGQPWQFISILFHTYVYMDPKLTTFGFTGLGGFSDFILSSAVGGFATFRYWLPEILIFACYSLLIFATMRQNTTEDKLLSRDGGKLALGGIVAFGVLVLAITYSLYVVWALPLLGPGATFAAGLQGRYFTAAFVVLIPIGIWLRRYVHISVKTDLLFASIIASTSCFLLLFYALQTLYVIRAGFFH